MRRYFLSLRYALEGLAFAFQTERNFRLFCLLYGISLLAGLFLQIRVRDWEVIIVSGAIFLAIELVNTALENFADAFDTHTKSQNDHHMQAIKATKDVAAAASLLSAIAWGCILLFVFWPPIRALIW